MSYRAPVKDMLFVMKELAGIEAVATLPGHEDAGLDTAAAVLEECAKFNEGVVAPLMPQAMYNCGATILPVCPTCQSLGA